MRKRSLKTQIRKRITKSGGELKALANDNLFGYMKLLIRLDAQADAARKAKDVNEKRAS